MINNDYNKKYISFGIIVLFSSVFYYLSSIFFWSSDCPFFALRFEMDDTDPYREMHGVKDLIESQCAHYMNWSGRFFCQFIVQIFCAFTKRPVFEICNLLVWIAFLISSFRLANITIYKPKHIFFFITISFFIFITLPLDPPFLINYLWMGTVVLIYINILLYSKSGSIFNLFLIFLYSVIAGNSQESFSIPLLGALAIWIFIQKNCLKSTQWFAIAGFASGTFVSVIAPGNFVRLGLTLQSDSSIIHNIFNALPQITISITLFVTILVNKVSIKKIFNSKLTSLLLLSVPFSILLGAVMKFENFVRILIPLNIFLSIITIRHIRSFRFLNLYYLFLSFALILTICHEYYMNKSNHKKYSLITDLYHKSLDGKILIPDDLFCKDDGNNNYYIKGFEIKERSKRLNPPPLKILPESLTKLRIINDTNFIIQIAPQAWIFGHSIKNPRKILVEKTFLPQTINVHLPDKIFDMTKNDDLNIDTINNTIIGRYINHRWYLKSNVQFK